MIDLFPVARPLLHRLDPERAHGLALRAVRAGLAPTDEDRADPILAVDLWGQRFPNPVGLAAGFDKNAEAVPALLRLGFGFVEVGTVTPRPQPGNPRPRMVRLPEREGLINRLGFNNAGLDVVVANVRTAKARGASGPIGVNIGRNKDQTEAEADYVAGIAACAPVADYLTVNVSSPNTPGLRALQDPEPLARLLRAVLAARAATAGAPPILLKIAPDLTEADRAAIAEVAVAVGIDGLVVSNTTISRPDDLAPDLAREAGGLSGPPLFALSTAVLRDMARRVDGRLPLVGVGGIASGGDAYAKIRSGASLVQLYTALAYRGPGLVRAITRDLAARLRADGYRCLLDAVGADL